MGNDIGVYASTDGGANWQEFQTGMPEAAIVMDLNISVSNRKLRAATHGNGVFERDLIPPTVGIEPISSVLNYKLGQNYPNPFNPETKIDFSMARSGVASITIYDILGRVVITLLNEYRVSGTYKVRWDGKDASGNKVPSGIYFYRLKTEDFTDIKKMTLIK